MRPSPAIERHEPGSFCWIELASPDPVGAKHFYTEVFGWSYVDTPICDAEVYTTWTVNGLEHAAMFKAPLQVPPHWGLYVCVRSADAIANKVRQAGGTVLKQPFDVMDYGRTAMVRDPQGAALSVWQPRRHIGARILNTVGTLCWSELQTKDPAAAIEFYTGLFGWRADTKKGGPPGHQTEYTEWITGGAHIGGMLEIAEDWGDAPPNWMPYFQVTDCLETVEKTRRLGGRVAFGPMPIENVGSFALIRDPQGAHFSVIEMNLVA